MNEFEPHSIPLSLYVHIPWCVKKCPYCDFNSYSLGVHSSARNGELPEDQYVQVLLQDLKTDLPGVQNRKLTSIFFGGGTPSLFSPSAFEKILNGVEKFIPFDKDIEITMEANPGTLEHKSFKDYKLAGINRISLGAQSFQAEKLKALGRIHQVQDIHRAIEALNTADICNFNIDLMYALPKQTIEDAIFDLKTAIALDPKHLSWYHLTLEPNTYFHKYPPSLPNEIQTDNIQQTGMELLNDAGFSHYEVSAFAKVGAQSRHNLNYWQFGDYLGIGAGAHSKITDYKTKTIWRYAKTRTPTGYLSGDNITVEKRIVDPSELPLEFMLNTLRLMEGFPIALFEQRTFLPFEKISDSIQVAKVKGFLNTTETHVTLTSLGKQYLNNVMELF